MQVLYTLAEVRQARASLGQLGFVPTMGYLHAGHAALVRQAQQACETVAVSIFVNPTQFGPHEDLANYPRDLEHDLSLLRDLGCTFVWIPEATEIYPPGFNTYVEVGGITDVLEGARRPGHFRGVATVVTKLFNVVQPTWAYFGQKDAQQTVVIKQLVRDLALPVEIVVVPTIREADGLALSSRNVYLDPQERQAATVLSRALRAAEQASQAGEQQAEALRLIMLEQLHREPLAHVEYVSVAHPHTLQELTTVDRPGALISLAVRIGRTRLIDNLIIPA